MRITALVSAALILVLAVGIYLVFGGRHSYAVTEVTIATTHLRIVEANCQPRLDGVGQALAKSCATCAVVQSCPTTVDAELSDALANRSLKDPYVRAGTMREIVKAPAAQSGQICHAIATALLPQQKDAECVEPR
jgi:hypothetical protein